MYFTAVALDIKNMSIHLISVCKGKLIIQGISPAFTAFTQGSTAKTTGKAMIYEYHSTKVACRLG